MRKVSVTWPTKTIFSFVCSIDEAKIFTSDVNTTPTISEKAFFADESWLYMSAKSPIKQFTDYSTSGGK